MDKVVVHVDGGARGNPGPAAAAAVATAPDGTELAERSVYMGAATNNVAEYRALLLGLELARELGAREVEVVNDSELVARQVGGEYKVKNAGLKPLFLEAMRTLRGFDGWAVRSVRREHNERADALVNETSTPRARRSAARRCRASTAPCLLRREVHRVRQLVRAAGVAAAQVALLVPDVRQDPVAGPA